MRDTAEGTGTFYNLFQHINYLLGFHCVAFLALLLDLLCPLLISCQKIPFRFILFYNYCWLEERLDKGVLISSLLVVWTFITVVIVFYMERRENRYCGVRIWDIVAFELKPRQKYAICFLFFAELAIILIGTFLEPILTLIVFIPIYTVTAGCVLWFVVRATAEQIIWRNLKAIIRMEYQNAPSQNDRQYMQAFIDALPACKEKELEFLIDLMTEDIIRPYIARGWPNFPQMQKEIYNLMICILEKMRGNTLKVLFVQSLGARMKEVEADENELLPLLYSVALPMLERMDDTWLYLYTDFIAALHPWNGEVHKKMLLGGSVYTLYLETCTAENEQEPVRMKIAQFLGQSLTDSDKQYIHRFWTCLFTRTCQENAGDQEKQGQSVNLDKIFSLFV